MSNFNPALSIIEHALNHVASTMGENGVSSTQRIAQLVEESAGLTVIDQMATAYKTLVRMSREDKQAGLETDLYPITMLSLIQKVQNRVCWNARKIQFARNRAEASNRGENGNGLDYSEGVAESLGFEPGFDDLGLEVLEAFDNLQLAHGWIVSQLFGSSLDIESLYVFTISAPDEETGKWFIEGSAETLDEAYPLMERVVDESEERSLVKLEEEVANLNLTGQVVSRRAA